MGASTVWSPFEALIKVSAALPDAEKDEKLLKSLGIGQGVMNRIHDAIYAATTTPARAADDVFAALVDASVAVNKVWVQSADVPGKEAISVELLNGIDAAIHRGHLDYVTDIATQSPNANVGDLYDNDPRYASALVHLIPNFEYPDWSAKQAGQVGKEVVALEGAARQSSGREEGSPLFFEITRSGPELDDDKREPWRFANGFVDDVLYYTEGQRLYEAAVSRGDTEEADSVAGLYNLDHQKELSGFTLESFANDWAEAQRENILLDAKFMGLTNIDPVKLARVIDGEGPDKGLFVGKIVGVDVENGLVFQAAGRGDGVVLPLDKLSRPVEIGEMATITFKDGRGVVADRGQAQARGGR